MERPSIMKPEDAAALIHKVMARHQLTTNDIDDKRNRDKKGHRGLPVYGFGEFECDDEECTNEWKSFFSWITLDLKEQRITYRWRMKCQYCCQDPRHTGVRPVFSLEEMEKLIEQAIRVYRTGSPFDPNKRPLGRLYRWKPKAPHNNNLCEKCEWGATQCWLKQNRQA